MSASRRSAASNSSRRSKDTKSTLAGALYFERDEVGDCNKFTPGLGRRLRGAGRAAALWREPCDRIETSGGKVTGVVTDKGRIAADTVVVAMGSFTAPLLAKLGIRVPIYPVKGVSITFERGAWNSAPNMPVIDDSKLFGLVPIGDRMRISGSAEITGYDTTPAMTRAQAIIDNANFTFPEMKQHLDLTKARVWAGLRPVSPAGTPIIGANAGSRVCGSMPATGISAGRCRAAPAGSRRTSSRGKGPKSPCRSLRAAWRRRVAAREPGCGCVPTPIATLRVTPRYEQGRWHAISSRITSR